MKITSVKNYQKLGIALTIVIIAIFGFISGKKEYSRIFHNTVNAEINHVFNPEEPIVINFSFPMLQSSTEKSIAIAPQTEVNYIWSDANKKLTIRPKNFWGIGQGYSLKVNGARNIFLTTAEADFSFHTEDYPAVISFDPSPNAKDVVLDMEEPITASFDKPIDNFKLKFVVAPNTQMNYEVDSNKKKARLLLSENLSKGQTYTIQTFVRYIKDSDENYKKIYESSFSTKAPEPVSWQDTLAARVEKAKKYTVAPIKTGKCIDIDTKMQIMTIFENGQLLDAYLVSSGKRGMETPVGTYHISNKTPRAWSKEYHLFMPFWEALVPSGKFGIHELPEWPNGYKEGLNHLGTPVSHGCVRLGVGPAQRVYSWTDIGTPVVVHN